MSIVTLDPEVRQKLEHALNAKIPGPDDEAFEGFAQSLRLAHPELHRELLQGVRVAAKMPVENAVKRAAWRRQLRETLNRLFYQKQWPDDLVLNKKRVMFAGLGTLMLLLPVAFILRGNLIGSADEADAPTPQANEEVITVTGTAQPAEQVEAAVPERSSANDELSSEPLTSQGAVQTNDARTPIPPEHLPQTAASSSPPFTPFPTTTPPQPTPTQIPSSFPSQSPEPALPTQLMVATSPPKPESITVWRDEATGTVSSNDSFPGASPSPPGSGAIRTQTPTVFARQAEQPPTLTAYTSGDPTPETASPMSMTPSNSEGQTSEGGGATQRGDGSSQRTEGSSLTVYAQKGSAEPSSSASPAVFSRNQLGVVEDASAPPIDAVSDDAESQPPVEAAGTVQTRGTEPRLDTFLRPGDRVPATLATGIVITDNASVPVIAESKGDWCGAGSCPEITWVGEATLSASNRVEIDFNQAVISGEVRSMSGLALSSDTVPGLPAELRDMSPTAAQALLQSAVGGVSDYVNALANQKRLVFQGDNVIQEGQVPSIESFILGRVAGLLAPPETRAAEVRVASIPAGTPLAVLYGVGSN